MIDCQAQADKQSEGDTDTERENAEWLSALRPTKASICVCGRRISSVFPQSGHMSRSTAPAATPPAGYGSLGEAKNISKIMMYSEEQ